jgi:hypothetical protein
MDQRFKTLIKIAVIAFLGYSCTVSKNENSLKSSEPNLIGLWYAFLPDSSYAEVYFTDSLYCFSNSDYLNLFKYRLTEDDSMQVLDDMFDYKFKLQKIGATIISSSKYGSVVYTKIEDSVFSYNDWKMFINGNPEIGHKYRQYFVSREWEALDREQGK